MSTPNHQKAIKIASQSEHVSYFMPMLESFQEHGELNEVIKNCVAKSCDIWDSGVPLFPNGFKKEDSCGVVRAEFEGYSAEELEAIDTVFVLAGRIISSRSFGKVIFFHLQDRTGRLQCYADKSRIDENEFKVFKKLDVGDIVGVNGTLFRTKTGELTLSCSSVKLLTKSFRPLPDKHAGLTNVEMRFRQRYVDLIVNPKARDVFRKRSRIIREFRNFMENRDFVEVETPMMHPLAGGANARPFVTHHNALDMELYLRIAPELYLKRLIVGGLEKVFEILSDLRERIESGLLNNIALFGGLCNIGIFLQGLEKESKVVNTHGMDTSCHQFRILVENTDEKLRKQIDQDPHHRRVDDC